MSYARGFSQNGTKLKANITEVKRFGRQINQIKWICATSIHAYFGNSGSWYGWIGESKSSSGIRMDSVQK